MIVVHDSCTKKQELMKLENINLGKQTLTNRKFKNISKSETLYTFN